LYSQESHHLDGEIKSRHYRDGKKMSGSKKILITGDTKRGGIGLLTKLLGEEYLVKVLDRYIYSLNDAKAHLHKGADFRYNDKLILINGGLDNIKLIEESITVTPFTGEYYHEKFNDSKCETVVYLASSKQEDRILNNLSVLVKTLRDCGAERFLYISSCNKGEAEFTELKECLGKITNEKFVAITVQSSTAQGYFSRFLVNVNIHIMRNKIIQKGKITHCHFKNGVSRQFINSMPNIVSYLLGYPTETIEKDLAANTATYRCILNSSNFYRKVNKHRSNIIKPIVRRFFYLIKYLKRLLDVFMMMLLLHLWPEQVYRFSTRRLLADKTRRYNKETPFHHAYEFLESKSSNVKKVKELNVVIRGGSFDLKCLGDLNPPTYLACLSNPISNSKECIYITSIRKAAYFKKLGYQVSVIEPYITVSDGNCKPMSEVNDYMMTNKDKALYRNVINYMSDCETIAIHEKIFRPSKPPLPYWTPVGSGLPSVYALSFIAEKINVYGWDFHMTSSPKDMNYWQVLLRLYQYVPDKLSRYQLESSLFSFYYGYHLSRLPNINIHGYLGQLGQHEKLIRKLERVLFN
jgi:hypothetical protein